MSCSVHRAFAIAVGRLRGEDADVQSIVAKAGTLNVFRGKNTAHRVTPVVGPVDRIIADEVIEPETNSPFGELDCPASWSDVELPMDLPYRDFITSSARASDLDPWLVASVVQTESAFDSQAVSRAGAAGLMQLMPAAAAEHEVHDVFNPAENLRGGAEHLRIMLDRFDSLALALAAYNSGATTVTRYNGIPPYKETQDYVRRVLKLFCPQK